MTKKERKLAKGPNAQVINSLRQGENHQVGNTLYKGINAAYGFTEDKPPQVKKFAPGVPFVNAEFWVKALNIQKASQ